ncbi:MAG: MBOAT family protein, partial [Eubacteriales bacterium]
MLFSSFQFILFFFPLFLLVYFTAHKRRTRNVILLIFSLIFYAWGEPLYLFLMLFSLTVNYFSALFMDRHRDKAKGMLVCTIAVNLLLLGGFKYTGFVAETLNLIPGVHLTVPSIALPIGISFYTFQIMSYVIDVYRGDTAVQRDYINLGAYLSAFPQLIAGPIVRYSTVAEELENRRETLDDFAAGLRRFIMGLSKKVLIANVMAETADLLLASSAEDYGI